VHHTCYLHGICLNHPHCCCRGVVTTLGNVILVKNWQVPSRNIARIYDRGRRAYFKPRKERNTPQRQRRFVAMIVAAARGVIGLRRCVAAPAAISIGIRSEMRTRSLTTTVQETNAPKKRRQVSTVLEFSLWRQLDAERPSE
jgi:hypothetical protein